MLARIFLNIKDIAMLNENERLQVVETLLQAQRECRQAKLLTDSFTHI